MALLAPGIEVIERDASLVVPIAGSSYAVYCGNFVKGPCDIPVLIGSVQDLITTFGYPTNDNYNDWYQVYSFLLYSNTIYVVRTGKTTVVGNQGVNSVYELKYVNGTNSISDATMTANASYIANVVTFEHATIDQTADSIKVISKYMGTDGNNISVAFDDYSTISVGNSSTADSYQYLPTQDGGEVAVTVRYKGEIVETFLVHLTEGTKDYNNKSMYIDDVINRQSQYIYTVCKTTVNSDICGLDTVTVNNVTYEITAWHTLISGTDSTLSTGDITLSYTDNFSDKEAIDVDIIIVPEGNIDVATFCKTRADVIGYVGASFNAVVGIPSTTAVSNLVTEFNDYANNGYVSYIGNYAYIYDLYSDKFRWINIAGHSAGLRAYTSNVKYPWFASAGLNIGVYKNIRKLGQNFNEGQRGVLYKNAINSAVTFPNQGTVLWGQKVALTKPSSMDRVNVRMLFNYAERAITKMSKYVIFEQNTDTTRNMFVSTVKPFFERIKASQGLEDYLIICDTTNNTAIVRQNNQFIADFYLKPAYTIEFITLRFTAVGASVSFSDVTGMA